MKEIKDSKIRIKRSKVKKDFENDTFSITRELEKTLKFKQADDELKDKNRKSKLIRTITVLVIIAILSSVGGYLGWMNIPVKRNAYSSHYLISSNKVEVIEEKNGNLIFEPKINKKNIGIVIIPSSKINNKSYSSISNMLASKGYYVVVSKLRFNIPILSSDLISSSFEKNGINTWYVVGHSKSGSSALKQASNNKKISGVIFLGSYTQEDNLKLINKPVLSIWGTKDGLIDFSKFDEYKKYMPSNAKFYEIIGGNNSNFADIELLSGDSDSIIKSEEQKKTTVDQINLFIMNGK